MKKNKKHPLRLLAFAPTQKATYTLPDESNKKRIGFVAQHLETYTSDFILFILFILFIRDTGQDWETGRQLGTDTGRPRVRTTRMKRMK